MAQQTIGVGTSANDGTGDTERAAFGKVNANFSDLYALVAKLGIFTPVRTITAAGTVTMLATDGVLLVNKPTGSATPITLEASPVTGATHIVKDGKGDAATNPITITPASGTIDGASSFVINTAPSNGVRPSVTIVYTGAEWSLV